jgi:hypothetical protein
MVSTPEAVSNHRGELVEGVPNAWEPPPSPGVFLAYGLGVPLRRGTSTAT